MIVIIKAIATAVKVSPYILLGICTTESNLRNVINHNDGGSPSYGICQIKLNTAKMFNPRITPKELMNPELNAYYAARYIKHQMNRYNENIIKAIAAYNSGRVKYNKSGRIINYKYVRKVLTHYDHYYREDNNRSRKSIRNNFISERLLRRELQATKEVTYNSRVSSLSK